MINDTNKNKKHIVIVTGNSGGSAEGAVRYDEAQVLTDEEKAQARENIGAIDANDLATVASTGDYDDLLNKPTIPAAQVQSDWSQSDNTAVDYIKNKPTINTEWFGTQAEYDLIDPKDPDTIYHIEGGGQQQSDWNQSDNTAVDYIKNKPTIPAAQVNSDWNANSGVAEILNKPTIPVVPEYTTENLTFTLQGGTTKTLLFYVAPKNYFYVEDISGNSNELTIGSFDGYSIDVYMSTDRENWSLMGNTDSFPTATIPANSKLYLKANTSSWGNATTITASGNFNVGGNIMSLLNGDNFENTTLDPLSTYIFSGLFSYDSYLISAEDLVLPNNVAYGCYGGMFSNCSALTTPPALPATTLVYACYDSMFINCTSLTTAPALPATSLDTDCYNTMFYGCSSLNSVTIYANNISALGCLNAWLADVAATGDFYNLGSPAPTYPSGISGIPTGWTEHTSL